ncbi:hypothetical protein TNIN_349121, partial [Trichonephila inaurata madagascariensis]
RRRCEQTQLLRPDRAGYRPILHHLPCRKRDEALVERDHQCRARPCHPRFRRSDRSSCPGFQGRTANYGIGAESRR